MKTASYVTTGAALQMVTLFGLAYATDSHLPGISPMAAVSIFIDGTKDIIPTDDSQEPDRMKGALNYAFDQKKDYVSEKGHGGNIFIDYPREFGIMTGLGSESYEDSKADAAVKIKAAIKDAVKQNPGDPVYVVGFSQGSNAASDVIAELEAEDPNFDASNVTFVLLGNGARNDGGLWARMPAGVYVPLIGLRFGASTNPAQPDYAENAPQVIQISKQYDGASDVPKYVLNPVAWANVALGFMSVHNGYYNEVNLDLTGPNGLPDGKVDQLDVEEAKLRNDDYIVTTNGNITDIVIRNKVGDLPLTQPLLALGVPRKVVEALDPLLRAIIETGYDRAPDGGTYAATPVHLELAPGPHQWFKDFHKIAAGMRETEEKLAELDHEDLTPEPNPQPLMQEEEEDEGETLAAKQAVVPTQTSKPYTVVPTQQLQPAAVTPTPAVVPPPVTQDPVPGAELQQTANVGGAPAGGEGTAPTTSKPQVNINKSLQQINKAITGTVKTVVGALTPKKKTTTPTTGTTDPGPETTGGSTPDNDPPSQDPGNEAPAA
ncbi:PE-PPE domain-containing protein [Mycobacterium sp. GA-2829]|uniref:PE-PPE domain-containing protein n=1 Tax=Mycobacterium sp. GA-2829 TaxID=1772283 RepID=UPI00074005B9|nr:PE-PPE domain-containing protein [Mycobacterium sp. GA-2829]KUI39128.1 PE-PPE domain-containing protein [Mycobacterium sp. GA-2829]